MISQFIHARFRMGGLATTQVVCYVCQNICFIREIPKRGKKVLCPRCAAVAHDNEKIIARGEIAKILKPKITVRDGKIVRQ